MRKKTLIDKRVNKQHRQAKIQCINQCSELTLPSPFNLHLLVYPLTHRYEGVSPEIIPRPHVKFFHLVQTCYEVMHLRKGSPKSHVPPEGGCGKGGRGKYWLAASAESMVLIQHISNSCSKLTHTQYLLSASYTSSFHTQALETYGTRYK